MNFCLFVASTTAGMTGDGGDAASALLNVPRFIWVDSAGSVLYFTHCTNDKIRAVNFATSECVTCSSCAAVLYVVHMKIYFTFTDLMLCFVLCRHHYNSSWQWCDDICW